MVAERQKLIPSVMAAIEIQRNGLGKREAVGYSGPTYIGISLGDIHRLLHYLMDEISTGLFELLCYFCVVVL